MWRGGVWGTTGRNVTAVGESYGDQGNATLEEDMGLDPGFPGSSPECLSTCPVFLCLHTGTVASQLHPGAQSREHSFTHVGSGVELCADGGGGARKLS